MEFYAFRALQARGVGYAGSGVPVRRGVLRDIVNVPAAARVHWLRSQYFPGRSLEEIADEPLMRAFLRDLGVVRTSEAMLSRMGYEVTGARLVPSGGGPEAALRAGNMRRLWLKQEDVGAYFSRLGIGDSARIEAHFDIELALKPIPQGH